MIDETIFKSDYLGKDGFIWWLGQVASPESWKAQSLHANFKDPKKADKNWPERCKVRIIGYHTFRTSELKDEDLPWAHVLMDPSFGSGQGGEGITNNLKGGETCFGFFLDGDDAQQPVVVGLLHRHRMVENYPKDDEFAFRPFTGHSGDVPSTKREKFIPSAPKESPSPITETIAERNPGIAYTDGNFIVSSQSFDLFNPESSVIGSGVSFSELANIGLGVSFADFNPYNIKYGDALWSSEESLAHQIFLKKTTFSYTKPSGCKNNMIGEITQILQDFIAFTNGIQKYADVYIDPILNEIVDIGQSVKSVARSIGGIIRLIINSIRGGLSKCIISLFKKFIGLIIPKPQQTIAAQSSKNILDILFCLFEKLIPQIISTIEGLLLQMVDSVFTAPICAIEQWVAGILTSVMTSIEESIDYIISGINWLTGGLSNVFNVLNQASSLASTIYNFIGCDGLKCKQPSKWISNIGPSLEEEDNWNKIVGNINIIKDRARELNSVESAISELSLYGQSVNYDDCNQSVNNPTSQEDIPFLLPGVKLKQCIPPIVSVYGDGLGAKLVPIIDSNGSIINIKIVSGGFGYSYAPILTIVDKSGYGRNAQATSIIDSKGTITKIIIKNKGIGYCRGEDNILSDVFITSSKNKLYEGENFEVRVTTRNIRDNDRIKYEISGVKKSNIKQDLEGFLIIKNNTASITIETIADDIIEYKELIFRIPEYEEEISVLIEDISRKPQNRAGITSEYSLTSSVSTINEGQSFDINLKTKGLKDNTLVPFIISGITTSLIKNQNVYGNFEVIDNKATIKIDTNKGIIKNNEVFKLELTNKKSSIGILIKLIKSPGISTEPKVCIQELVVVRPGIGYTLGDTISDGSNTYYPIISPNNGSIVSVKPLDNPQCGYTSIPDIVINTNTGIGAEILPVLVLEEDVVISDSLVNSDRIGIGLGSTSVIDCI